MTSKSFAFANHHRLSFARFGKPGGKPVFYFHGWPSSKAQAALAHETALDFGVEIVAPDRPGIGQSTFEPHRKITDWPSTVEALAQHLGWTEYGALGVSGGGPYAVACAANPPRGLTKVGIACGVPHCDWLKTSELVRPAMRRAARMPSGLAVPMLKLARATVSIVGGRNILRLGRPFMQEFDRGILDDPNVLSHVADSAAEAFTAPVRGMWHDFKLMTHDWGASLESARVPTQLWYGDRDNVCPQGDLPPSILDNPLVKCQVFPDEGHYSLPVRYVSEIIGYFVSGESAIKS